MAMVKLCSSTQLCNEELDVLHQKVYSAPHLALQLPAPHNAEHLHACMLSQLPPHIPLGLSALDIVTPSLQDPQSIFTSSSTQILMVNLLVNMAE